MAQLRIDIKVDQPGKESPKRKDSLPFPAGFTEIKARLKKRGEAATYAKEHAARIWNDSHPEDPVETSFDGENGGFKPGNSDLEKKKQIKLKDKKKKKSSDDDEDDE